jgi:hypothetical protein
MAGKAKRNSRRADAAPAADAMPEQSDMIIVFESVPLLREIYCLTVDRETRKMLEECNDHFDHPALAAWLADREDKRVWQTTHTSLPIRVIHTGFYTSQVPGTLARRLPQPRAAPRKRTTR